MVYNLKNSLKFLAKINKIIQFDKKTTEKSVKQKDYPSAHLPSRLG